MPIKPENKDRYPANWKEIVERIRHRSGDVCEGCGVVNGAYGYRLSGGHFIEVDERFIGPEWDAAYEAMKVKIIKIVLTVAHLDHTPENCDDSNLKHWCQKCHNSYDVEHRKETRKETQRNKQQTTLDF